MTPRDEKGRFVSAKPVLHRQVVCDALEWNDAEQMGSIPQHITGNLTVEVHDTLPAAEWLQVQPKFDPHGPRIEVAVVWAIVAAVAAGLAFVAHMLGALG